MRKANIKNPQREGENSSCSVLQFKTLPMKLVLPIVTLYVSPLYTLTNLSEQIVGSKQNICNYISFGKKYLSYWKQELTISYTTISRPASEKVIRCSTSDIWLPSSWSRFKLPENIYKQKARNRRKNMISLSEHIN